MSRLEKLRNVLESKDWDGVVITDPYSLRYYTGFRGGEGTAVVTDSSAVLIVDSRYTEAAGKESDFKVEEYNAQRSRFGIISDIIRNDSVTVLAFEDRSITFSGYIDLKNKIGEELGKTNFSDPEWVQAGNALEIPRRLKEKDEIDALRRAEHIGDMAFQHILGVLKPGMTELEVAAEIEYALKRNGATGLSFDTIAASGENSSMPHAIPGERRLREGDFLTMDFGCIYDGYCSDMTRTVCIGKASHEQRMIYDIVLSAQLAVLDRVRAGMVCKEADAIARDIIRDAGYGDFFGHGLGHGVGLYIHESPALNTRDETVLEAGMIETDEPGIYLPGKFGVRIEDMILITKDGCENLAESPKELIEI